MHAAAAERVWWVTADRPARGGPGQPPRAGARRCTCCADDWSARRSRCCRRCSFSWAWTACRRRGSRIRAGRARRLTVIAVWAFMRLPGAGEAGARAHADWAWRARPGWRSRSSRTPASCSVSPWSSGWPGWIRTVQPAAARRATAAARAGRVAATAWLIRPHASLALAAYLLPLAAWRPVRGAAPGPGRGGWASTGASSSVR